MKLRRANADFFPKKVDSVQFLHYTLFGMNHTVYTFVILMSLIRVAKASCLGAKP